ncbi:MAG TPA: DUF4344 domain-containing metallopeptidase [Polyangiales bacterium]|nr:DUF4344 domain-containing metallopeptidase [Polyangiales bacterium]
MSTASTSVIEQPPESIGSQGLDCQRAAGREQSMVPPDLLEDLRADAKRMVDDLLATARDELGLPDALTVTHADCPEQNAFYYADTKTIELCDKLFANVAALWFDPNRTEPDNRQRILGAWRFVFFHELGHALVDLYKLPVDKQEDAVDDFSILKLIEAGLTEDALSAAGFWHNKSKDNAPCTSFFDEHSLRHERFQAILCLVYGSDPAALGPQVAQYMLSEQQLCVCPLEFAKQRAHWRELLDQPESSASLCGYLETQCCDSSYPCESGLACRSAKCVPAACN